MKQYEADQTGCEGHEAGHAACGSDPLERMTTSPTQTPRWACHTSSVLFSVMSSGMNASMQTWTWHLSWVSATQIHGQHASAQACRQHMLHRQAHGLGGDGFHGRSTGESLRFDNLMLNNKENTDLLSWP